MAKKILIGALVLISAYAAILIFFGNERVSPNINQPIAINTKTEANKPNSPLKNPISQVETQNNDKTTASAENPSIAEQEVENTLHQYLEEDTKNFDATSLKPIIDIKDLKIINSTSKELTQDYINNINAVYGKYSENLKRISIEEELSSSDLINFDPIISAYKETIGALYKVVVPQNLVFVHQEQIAILSAQSNALQIAKDNYENDPIKALSALEVSNEFNQELLNLQDTFANAIQQ